MLFRIFFKFDVVKFFMKFLCTAPKFFFLRKKKMFLQYLDIFVGNTTKQVYYSLKQICYRNVITLARNFNYLII